MSRGVVGNAKGLFKSINTETMPGRIDWANKNWTILLELLSVHWKAQIATDLRCTQCNTVAYLCRLDREMLTQPIAFCLDRNLATNDPQANAQTIEPAKVGINVR